MKLARTLFVATLALLTLSSCDRGSEAIDAVNVCGVETTIRFGSGEIESARKCFIEAHQARLPAQFFVVNQDQLGSDVTGTAWVTFDGWVEIVTVSVPITPDRSGVPNESMLLCSRLEETDDGSVFRPKRCGDPTRIRRAPNDGPATILCGVEVVINTEEHRNSAARSCFQDAWELGKPARFFSTMIGIEGGWFTEIYTTGIEEDIHIYEDTRDPMGRKGHLQFTCRELAPEPEPEPEPRIWKATRCIETFGPYGPSSDASAIFRAANCWYGCRAIAASSSSIPSPGRSGTAM